MKTVRFNVEGMSCPACSGGLEKYLNKQKGVVKATVDLLSGVATVVYREEDATLSALETYIRKAGFTPAGEYDERVAEKKKSPLLSLVLFGVLFVFTLLFSMGVIGKGFPFFVRAGVLFILSLAFIAWNAGVYVQGVKHLFRGIPDMDTLVAIGSGASFLYSVVLSVIGITAGTAYPLYFESVAGILYFVRVGRALKDAGKNEARLATLELVKITPKTATVFRSGAWKTLPLDEVKKGDELFVKLGETVPVDGVVLDGEARFDESFLTGESRLLLKKVGDGVLCGTVAEDGEIKMRAERVGRESRISEIVRLLERASGEKLKMAELADKVSGILVPVVCGVAVLTFLLHLLFGAGINVALERFVSVLVVACPCALGLATPLAVSLGTGWMAKNGILVKNPKCLEAAAKVDACVFDKTGTLTYGKMRVAGAGFAPEWSPERVLSLVASLESGVSHPVARALLREAEKSGLSLYKTEDARYEKGRGVFGTVDGVSVAVGNDTVFTEKPNERFLIDVEKSARADETRVYVAADGKPVGIFLLSDTLRDNASEAVRRLKLSAITPVMATGDREDVARVFARQTGITEVFGGVLPADKVNVVKKLKAEGKTVMTVGDGINDGPALALSDVGVGLDSGTGVANAVADVVLTGDDLLKTDVFIRASKATVKTVKFNLFWAFFYNGAALPLAAGLGALIGLPLTPLLASGLMALSSVSVVAATLTLKIRLNRKTAGKKV